MQPGEQLKLLSEFAVPRTSFGVRMAFSPVRPILFHTGVAQQVQAYDFETGEVGLQIQDFPGRTPSVLAVSPDGGLVVADDGPALVLWDSSTGERIRSIEMPALFAPLSAGFLAGGLFYADDEAGNLALWETADWQEVAQVAYVGVSDGAFFLPGDEGVVLLIRDHGELNILDWSGRMVRSVPTGARPWRFVAVSPLGDQAALHVDAELGTEGILIMGLSEGSESFRVPMLNIRAVALSMDWRTLAVADASEQLSLLDPSTGELFYSQALEAFQIDGLSISPDGALLAVYLQQEGEPGSRIQIWGRGLP